MEQMSDEQTERQYMALEVTPDGVATMKGLRTFGDLQSLVGGYLEQIKVSSCDVWVNEEGRLVNLRVNPAATRLAQGLGWAAREGETELCGTVVFLGKEPPYLEEAETQPWATSVPEKVVDLWGRVMRSPVQVEAGD